MKPLPPYPSLPVGASLKFCIDSALSRLVIGAGRAAVPQPRPINRPEEIATIKDRMKAKPEIGDE